MLNEDQIRALHQAEISAVLTGQPVAEQFGLLIEAMAKVLADNGIAAGSDAYAQFAYALIAVLPERTEMLRRARRLH